MTALTEYTFTLTNPYTIQKGDRIMIEYGGPPSVNIEIWNVDKFDAVNTRRIRYDGTSYIFGGTEDVAGTTSYVIYHWCLIDLKPYHCSLYDHYRAMGIRDYSGSCTP
jgi:hypothetical protein